MLHILANSPVDAWLRSVRGLIATPELSGTQYRNDILLLEMENSDSKNYFDDRFPMTVENIDVINDFLVSGNQEDKVIHDWTKLYRHRLVTPDYDQIQNVIDYLKRKPQGLRAQMSVWKQEIDLYGDIGPCFQLAWFRILSGKLEMHVHMRACDCYGKLLMNVNEFVSLQNHIAKEVGVSVGKYVQFVDSCHFNTENKASIDALISELKK